MLRTQKLKLVPLVIVVIVAAACLAQAGEPKFLAKELLDEGWISLFDGETMFGWQPSGDAKWEVVDGEIHTDGSKPGWLMTTSRWANYTLSGEFRASSSTNSGVFLCTSLKPTNPASDCYEWNIAPDDNPFPTGSFVARQKATIWSKKTCYDDWVTFKITVQKNYIAGVVLGIGGGNESPYRSCDLVEKKPLPVGYIGLQSNQGPVSFRHLMLLPMELEPLFDGEDLTGWSTDRAEKCKFNVTKAGELHMSNGPGQIDTVADFTNFVLQIDCKANGDGLNSGVFFRTLREGRWAGYESQIQNGFKDGDRKKPKDFGTGAIYRRQPARYVVPNDREWFTKTIVADGPHMAAWVNGYQVSDWTDTRPANENAREGRRDAGGAIALQGHDATTDFLFHKIQAAELPRETPEVGGQGAAK